MIIHNRLTTRIALRLHEMKVTTKRKIGFAILSLLAVVAIWVALLPASAPRADYLVKVSITSITNDASGTRQATFRLANAGGHAVTISTSFRLENRSGQWRTNLVPARAMIFSTNLIGDLPFRSQSKRLGPTESFEVTLPLPFDDQGWRAAFGYLDSRSELQDALHDLSKLTTKIGLTKKRNRQEGLITAYTGWTDE
jgi:hypothetical protein